MADQQGPVPTMTEDELKRRAESYADEEFNSVPEDHRSLSFWGSEQGIKEVFKKQFEGYIMARYEVIPSKPDTPRP